MISLNQSAKADHIIHKIKHHLPSQTALKDFIHHNTLHAFQNENFFDAIFSATNSLGYKTSLTIKEYRELYANGHISYDIILTIIQKYNTTGIPNADIFDKMNSSNITADFVGNIGQVRKLWKSCYHVDLDRALHSKLFRWIGNYLDQGVSVWRMPLSKGGFLSQMREIQLHSLVPIVTSKRAEKLLFDPTTNVDLLLEIIVNEASWNEYYLFDQQFAHPGWSGMVSAIEDLPETLLDSRQVSLKDIIVFELILEIDVLDNKYGENWSPIGRKIPKNLPRTPFEKKDISEAQKIIRLWQLAYEWSYYDAALAGIKLYNNKDKPETKDSKLSMQAVLCIDDRECSFRRHIEALDDGAKTFGTPGYFGSEFFYKPLGGKFTMKLCPAPVTPKYLIKEAEIGTVRKKDFNFSTKTHGFFLGWLITHTVGFASAVHLFLNLFWPRLSAASKHSFNHVHNKSQLTVDYQGQTEDGLQVGYTIEEMADRVYNQLYSIGLINDFASLVYFIGHGASSANNTHYAGYDCGACSGRPGSVNARVICSMANRKDVREMLANRGITIPTSTTFIPALHDTTRDEIIYYDLNSLSEAQGIEHNRNIGVFDQALALNAKERSRRFLSINSSSDTQKVHKKVKARSVSLFEPRPELNHATNALCIVGRREFSKGVFLDRRAFMNSYNFTLDPDGDFLLGILRAAAPVCGGINLEYYFSRVDNEKLGAGTKLSHNVMGLLGVANGVEGDLRTGLPWQMVEVHDPIRLMIIVEHYPDVVLNAILKVDNVYEWFNKEWVHLSVFDPEKKEWYYFENGNFIAYETVQKTLPTLNDPNTIYDQINNILVSILNH